MKFASFAIDGRASYGLVEGDRILDIGALKPAGAMDLRSAIARGPLDRLVRYRGEATAIPVDRVTWLPVIPNPDKILCVGLNYESHRREAGRAEVEHPTIFLRVASSQVGHCDNIWRPRVSHHLDYEGELAVIVGRPGRYIAEADAFAHIAGYACYNEASVRDWQRHTHQFTPGKNFQRTGAFGPYLVTPDEVGDVGALKLETRLNGAVVQRAYVDQMIFSIARIIAYCSEFTRLEPGDVIATGTPGGVGFKRTPPVFMKPGDRVEVEITGLGTLINGIEDDRV
jgi:2-keto-4-pentenoate hydratase/2-oxohepta-3-ene-1,7-dioic acid hydratase in catechol pathway